MHHPHSSGEGVLCPFYGCRNWGSVQHKILAQASLLQASPGPYLGWSRWKGDYQMLPGREPQQRCSRPFLYMYFLGLQAPTFHLSDSCQVPSLDVLALPVPEPNMAGLEWHPHVPPTLNLQETSTFFSCTFCHPPPLSWNLGVIFDSFFPLVLKPNSYKSEKKSDPWDTLMTF